MIILQALFFICLLFIIGGIYYLYKNRNVDAYVDLRPKDFINGQLDVKNYNTEQLAKKKVIEDLNLILKKHDIYIEYSVDGDYGDLFYIYKGLTDKNIDVDIRFCRYEYLETIINELLETS